MNAFHRFAAIAILLLHAAATSAQRISEDFKIALPEQKVANSHYNTLRVIDSRRDTTNMGIVQLGAFNRKAWVRPEIPVDSQLHHVFNALIDSPAASGEAVLLLRSLSFAEITKAMSERGYVYFRADMFAAADAQYRHIGKIDTVVQVGAMDVTRALFRRGSKTISDFIAQQLVKTPDEGEVYALSEIMAFDSVQKRKLPVYNTPTLRDGVYRNFTAFLQQEPADTAPTLKFDKAGLLQRVSVTGPDGKPDKLRSSELYALVHEGKPYIATKFGYYPLEKRGDDFYFTGKAEVTADTGDMIMAGVFFGIIGSLIAADASAVFEMKIDHISGGFVRIRQVASTQ